MSDESEERIIRWMFYFIVVYCLVMSVLMGGSAMMHLGLPWEKAP